MNDLLCDSLKDKISYFYTSYREVHDEKGRATINYKKREIVAFSWDMGYAKWEDEHKALKENNVNIKNLGSIQAVWDKQEEVRDELMKSKWMPQCKLCESDFINAVTLYLKTDIEAALHSDNYLLRIFAFMDRRVGKRTLIKIKEEAEALPEWVKQFYIIRCDSERPEIQAHDFCWSNRSALEQSNVCGCFHCKKVYSPNEIDQWIDDGRTALCPHCGIDSVIAESTGYPMTEEFMTKMHKYWFSVVCP